MYVKDRHLVTCLHPCATTNQQCQLCFKGPTVYPTSYFPAIDPVCVCVGVCGTDEI
jgi:hypothetical protein